MPLSAADKRADPLDVYILLDCSSSMENPLNSAKDWLCTSILDEILQTGDHIVIWSFSEQPEQLFDLVVTDEASKEAIKQGIRAVQIRSGSANYAKALQVASRAEARRPSKKGIALVLMASSLSPSAGKDSETRRLLRFSRTESHPGWRMLTVGLGDIEARAKAAARAYMQDQKQDGRRHP